MKKFYSLLGVLAMLVMPAFAQEEDVTKYIKNPGFDVDLTWQKDGSTKEIIDKSKNFSARSQGWLAVDSTVYASTLTTGNGNWKRTDVDHSWNGFVGQIEGWTVETGSPYYPYGTTAAEWVYFGTVPYGLDAQAVPIADDNNGSFLLVPEKPESNNTDENLGALYLRSGWGASAAYKQEVSLPCAVYRLEYDIFNYNYEKSKGNTKVKNLCKVICRKDVFEDSLGFAAEDWTKHTIEFTATSDFTIQFGFQSDGSSNNNPFLLIDNIKLYKIGEADEESLLQSDILEYTEQLLAIANDSLAGFGGLCEQIQNKVTDFEDEAYSGDIEAMEKASKEAKAYIDTALGYIAIAQQLSDAIESAAELVESSNPYPGIDDLNAALEKAINTMESGDIDAVKAEIEALQLAVNKYYMSQQATPDNPADFSFNIDNPTFVSQGSWYIGQGGGDQRLHTGLTTNTGDAMTAWNAWRNDLNAADRYVSISQDLTNLPNGVYTVTADMCTQDGCITDQHVFAKASTATAVSPVMTLTGWDPYVWETLTTARVIVVDGKLTIGAIGHGSESTPNLNGGTDTDNRMGWFCVSNFKLNYLGEATAEEYAAAIQARIDEAKAYGASMHFPADKAAFLEVANAAKGIEDIDALNAAMEIAEASETEYNGIITGTYAGLQDSIANSANYTANAKKVAQVPVNYMAAYLASANATYTEAAQITPILRYYRDTLIPALINAENTQISDATGKSALQGTIDAVVAQLNVYYDNTEALAEFVNQLNYGIQIAQLADIDYSAGKDVTAYVTNPNIDSEAGWTYNRPVGDKNSTTSQGVDGNTSNRYLDCWQPTAGTTRYTAYQTINVPNGKYKVSNIMRATGEGVYLFASDKAPVKDAEDNLTLDPSAKNVLAAAKASTIAPKYISGATSDSITTDFYGEIWKAAADKIMAKFNIASATESASIYDLVVEANNGESTCPDGIDAADWAIFSARGGIGAGWFNNSLEIEVTDHVLTIGITCDSVFTSPVTTAVPFTGTWFSADNFVLTMVAPGTNTGWSPATGVEAVETEAQPSAVFTLSGARVNDLQKGINIIKMSNGQVKKVLVK